MTKTIFHPRPCAYAPCSKTFTPKRRWQVYHDPKCRWSAFQEKKFSLTRDQAREIVREHRIDSEELLERAKSSNPMLYESYQAILKIAFPPNQQ